MNDLTIWMLRNCKRFVRQFKLHMIWASLIWIICYLNDFNESLAMLLFHVCQSSIFVAGFHCKMDLNICKMFIFFSIRCPLCKHYVFLDMLLCYAVGHNALFKKISQTTSYQCKWSKKKKKIPRCLKPFYFVGPRTSLQSVKHIPCRATKRLSSPSLAPPAPYYVLHSELWTAPFCFSQTPP